jgi:hypothetical protein
MDQHKDAVEHYRGQALWPAYRVAKVLRKGKDPPLQVNIAEPAFYWRIQRDYDDVPDPKIILFNSKDNLSQIKDKILLEQETGIYIYIYVCTYI